MPLINTTQVVERYNRPEVESKVALKSFFLSDGVYQDPYAISSVHIFKRTQNLSPNTVLNDEGLVSETATEQAAMVYGVTGTGETDSAEFDVDNYTGKVVTDNGDKRNLEPADPCSGVSGVYRLGLGEFVVVQDGIEAGLVSGTTQNNNTIQNTASAAVAYFDVWTVKLAEGTGWKTYINEFQLYQNSFISTTERLMLRTRNRLYNKNVYLGSIINLKIGTEVTVENNSIDESVKNIFRESVVTNPIIEIVKINEDPNLPSRVTVVKSSNVDVTADNTMIYSFDTNTAFNNPKVSENVGSRSGTYLVRVTYNIVDEKIVSSPLYFTIK